MEPFSLWLLIATKRFLLSFKHEIVLMWLAAFVSSLTIKFAEKLQIQSCFTNTDVMHKDVSYFVSVP